MPAWLRAWGPGRRPSGRNAPRGASRIDSIGRWAWTLCTLRNGRAVECITASPYPGSGEAKPNGMARSTGLVHRATRPAGGRATVHPAQHAAVAPGRGRRNRPLGAVPAR